MSDTKELEQTLEALHTELENYKAFVQNIYSGFISALLAIDALHTILVEKEIFTNEEFAVVLEDAQRNADMELAQTIEDEEENNDEMEDIFLSGISIS